MFQLTENYLLKYKDMHGRCTLVRINKINELPETKLLQALARINSQSCQKSLLYLRYWQGRWKYFHVGGAEICTSPPRPPPCYRNIHHTIHIMHFTSVKVIWRLLDELKLFSGMNAVARSTFIKVFSSFKITYYPFTSS